MAGDWIKMRGNLWDDPRVGRLCDITGSTEAAIIGGLYWLWSSADQHTEDGAMPGLSLRQIDRKTGIQGLGAALCDIGWLVDDPQGAVIVKFTEHNGTSAKRRCMEAQRKANDRKASALDADNVRTDNGQEMDKTGHRAELEKEKEKEKKNPPTPKGECKEGRFPDFWNSWPATDRKQDRKKCLAKWQRSGFDASAEEVIAHVEAMKETRKWKDGYEPAPLTYLNGERWLDGVEMAGATDFAGVV